MKFAHVSWARVAGRLACITLAIAASSACSSPQTIPDAGDAGSHDATVEDMAVADGPSLDTPATCVTDRECQDMVFCNGAEMCAPGATGADSRGCVHATVTNPCAAGETCNEAAQRCDSPCATMGDGDGDGRRSMACGGDDCDDADPNRFPGNPEVCDSAGHDEDCDDVTFGFRDGDSDGYADSRCCNVTAAGDRHCGDDCDDLRPTVHPTQAEICDLHDNDCNGMIDEGVTLTYYVDADMDGYGDPSSTPLTGCSMPAGYADNSLDCNDANPIAHRGAMEICDTNVPPVDENCDGSANEGCMCTGSATEPCPGARGVCATGTRQCVSGAWGLCSILPSAESCNGLDDDCDGTVDNGVSVTCYPDADNDTYAAMGATAVQSCPVAGRDAVGGCPANQTNRLPSAATTSDCNDTDSSISPGAAEVCDAAMVDENCDGAANPMSLCECSGTAMRSCPLPGACAAGTQTCASGRWGSCSITPLTEVCNGIDDDCDASTDEGLTVMCYGDPDNDGYAAAGAASGSFCPVAGREAVGGCPSYQTNRMPAAGTTDCNPTDPAISPAAAELCDTAAVDENCDGVANPMTLCMCTGTMSRSCMAGGIVGACAAGTQTCNSGAWGPCSIAPQMEVCNGIDDDCNGAIDNGVTINCYPDADNDTYAAAGTAAAPVCPDSTRTAVGRCPNGYTNRAPVTGTPSTYDCQESQPARYPGNTETCDGVDNNCDSLVDNIASAGSNYCANGTAPRSCSDPACGGAAGTQSCVSCAWSVCQRTPAGVCTPGNTRTCTLAGHSCNGTDTCTSTCLWSGCTYPAETCNYADDNCNGSIDEGVTHSCTGNAPFSTWQYLGVASYSSTWNEAWVTATPAAGPNQKGIAVFPVQLTLGDYTTLTASVATRPVSGYANGWSIFVASRVELGAGATSLGVPNEVLMQTWSVEVDMAARQLRLARWDGATRTVFLTGPISSTCGSTVWEHLTLVAQVFSDGTFQADLTTNVSTTACGGIRTGGTTPTVPFGTDVLRRNRWVGVSAGTGSSYLDAHLYDFSIHRQGICEACRPY